jgi:hypothetical protein
LLDSLGLGNKSTNSSSPPTAALSGLSQDQMVSGLKAALGQGVQRAVGQLGHDGGFLTNMNVKIPIPDKLKSVDKSLRALKQDKLADDFVATMNHAAEQAVPEAASVFGDSIQHMTIEDARSILSGSTNAATQYFWRTTQTNLYVKFLPIVKKATAAKGVTASYKKVMDAVASNQYLSSLENAFAKPESLDVDAYVTNKALDGLFKMVAAEEKRIRENPAARGTVAAKGVWRGRKAVESDETI